LTRKAQGAVRADRHDVTSRVDMKKGTSQVGWLVDKPEYLVADSGGSA
jgi:hypothetical protein